VVEEKAGAPYYTTTFTPPGDPHSADIVWDDNGFKISNAAYLLVKDGNHDPAWYLFNIAGWNGEDPLELTGFWPNGGAISHVGIFGGELTVSTPDGGSVTALLGGALVALALIRRLTS
jgi:hypothetical protein